jgi:pyruvate oxidase
MVGHSNLGLADAFREAEERGELTYIGTRHDGAASFAASAYGKLTLTGGLAACFGIAGPGSTNLLTGLYDAGVDRSPVLALSGGVPSSQAGRGAFQDLDLIAAFADVARYQATLRAGSDHAELVAMRARPPWSSAGSPTSSSRTRSRPCRRPPTRPRPTRSVGSPTGPWRLPRRS